MSIKKKILIVDDEQDILDLLQYILEKDGYITETAKNGAKAVRKAKIFKPHLILLDIMMPKMDGIEATRIIRNTSGLEDVTIALLTALTDDVSEISAFGAGADDFINKPIKPQVLLSRVKALLRRNISEENEELSIIKANGITIDLERHIVIQNDNELSFPRKEFKLLKLLIKKPNKVFTRESILEKIWGDDVVVGDRTIDVHIRKLREKIGDDLIKTVKGVGYKFIE